MIKVSCKDCLHYREAPYGAPRTGCWHPDNMLVRQKDAYLDEQQQPGDNRQINLRGDCQQFESKKKGPSFLERILSLGS